MSLKIFVVIYSLVPLVGSAAMYEKRGNEPFRTGATFELTVICSTQTEYLHKTTYLLNSN